MRMLVLDNKDELKLLKKKLESCFPESLKKASETNYFAQSCAVFYRDLDSYKQLVNDTDAIDWNQEFLLQGLQDGVYRTSLSLAAAKHFSTKLVSRTQVFVLQKPLHLSTPTPVSGSKLKLSSLSTTHASLLNETWSIGGNEQSLQYLTQLISCFPSSCLLDARGCPVSWVLLDQFGCLTHAYTMPAHRGKGYIQLVIAALARKLESLDYPAYGDVLEDNIPMQKALQCLEACFTTCFLSYDLHTPAVTGSSNTQTVEAASVA
ncbi:glycine N-acyltransferase-like protein 3 isoform X2 [Hemicordylus capensis]|uniref:glycine N-acyltransferase-like protein 3 isoform X2 n=1 Tax=Hemicordylus capensis TaxID=884348 RepID=UPI002302EE67|nr:glycine N-acyltransferase-like protein 3 isoform X2 [Hemicordylus capensis]